MKFQEWLQAFFRGFFRWMGVGAALFLLIAFFSALSNGALAVKVTSLSPRGFEIVAWQGQDAIALIKIHDFIGSSQLNREKIRQVLEICQSSSLKGKVRALLLEIDSGGGGSIESEAIYKMILAYKSLYKIPVYAFVDGSCASGGYLIACAADKIVATDYSQVGCVGVLARGVNYSEAMGKVGLKPVVFYRGHGKDDLDPMMPPSADDHLVMDPFLESDYNRFVSYVARARAPALTEQALKQQHGAKTFPAHEAKRLGYIDEIGFDRLAAVSELAHIAHLSGDFALIEVKPSSSLSEIFVESSSSLLDRTLSSVMNLSQRSHERLFLKP